MENMNCIICGEEFEVAEFNPDWNFCSDKCFEADGGF